MSDVEPQSPCISVCLLDENDICVGCFRSAEEVTDWFVATAEQKREADVISQSTEQILEAVNHIRSATEEQTTASRHIEKAIEGVSSGTRQMSRALQDEQEGSDHQD